MTRNFILYLIPACIWGSTWLAIRFQLGVVDPLVSVGYRFLIAGLILLAYCGIRKINLKFNRTDHLFFMIQGVLLFGVNYWLVYEAEKTLPSGIVALMFSLIIFMNILNGAIFMREPIRKDVLLGGVMGIVGAGMVFWNELRAFDLSNATLFALVIVIVSVFLASLGNITSARNQRKGLPVIQTNGFGMLYGSLIMLITSALIGKPFLMDWSFPYVSSLVYLSLFGSIFAFGAYLSLLGRIGADRAAYVVLVVPIIALILSTVFEGYTWTAHSLSGVAVILAGNLLILRRKSGKPTPAGNPGTCCSPPEQAT